MTKIGILSLGCPRNLLDSEVMLGFLRRKGYEVIDTVAESDVAIVNTCSFIDSAKKESIDAILELGRLKQEGKIKALIVTGCLPQRFKTSLKKELPEVDAFLGVGNFYKASAIIDRITAGEQYFEVTQPDFLYDHTSPRDLISPKHYAYIKIAEGCDNRCNYCVIYKIRGKYRSRPVESVIAEVKQLAAKYPIKEINLIAQDTTYYGKDLYGELSLARLLRELTSKKNTKDYPDVEWIRLLYTHPAHFTDELIDVIKNEPLICKYLDLPIQHINDKILKSMGRGTAKKDIIGLIDKLRAKIPDLVLRSSLIVGHPGEGQDEFTELMNFIRQVKFERLGVFTYSREEGSPAYNYPDQVSEAVKKRRFERAMQIQQEVSFEVNKRFLGRAMRVLIDEKNADKKGVYIGRTYADAPEVDGQVFVHIRHCEPCPTYAVGHVPPRRWDKVGTFITAKITDTLEYDLVATT